MVPIPASSYFPPLEACLSGEQLLISWRTLFFAIENNNGASQPTLEQFLSDQAVIDVLSRPFDAFPQPSPQSKATFETKTSAINVTPSSKLRYDIKEVKEDALWLSRTANIDETAALRVVVEECQSRAAARLLGPLSEEELASIREAAGNNQFSSPVTVSLASRGGDAKDIQAEFDKEDNRRQRILMTYLSERRHLLKCVGFLLSAFSEHEDSSAVTGKGKGVRVVGTWLDGCGRTLASQIGSFDDYASRCFTAIGTFIQNVGSGSGWDDETPGLEMEYIRNQLMEATLTMEIVFQLVSLQASPCSSRVVLEWLRLLQTYGFLDGFNTDEPSLLTLLHPLRCAAMIVSLSIFSIGSVLEFLDDPDYGSLPISADVSAASYFLTNTSTLAAIHQIIVDAADARFVTAGPILLVWSSILKALNLRVTDNREAQSEEMHSRRFDPQASSSLNNSLSAANDPYDELIDNVMSSLDDQNPIDFLAQTAINRCQTLEILSDFSLRLGNTPDAFFSNSIGAKMRIIILDLIKSLSSIGLGYGAEVMEPLLSSLFGGQSYWDFADSKQLGRISDPVAAFLGDNELVAAFLDTAMSRYPYESLPFLRLVHAVATCASCLSEPDSKSALSILETLHVFTYILPYDFVDYELWDEDKNENGVRLKKPINLFESRAKSIPTRGEMSLALTLADKDFCIPAGTTGRIIAESPRVGFWFHQYSGLKYFGKLLETFLTASDLVDATTRSAVDRDSVVEIIDILASLLLSITQSSATNRNYKDDAQMTFEMASSGLNRTRDIIAVVFDIFEEELQRQSTVSGSDVPLGVLVSCVHFIHAIIPFQPGRVYSWLSQSGLLGVTRGEGKMSTIVEGVELISGRYDFLISCARLYEAVVEDIASNAINRRDGAAASGRFNDREEVGTGVPDPLLSKIVLTFSRCLVDVLESSFSWKFVSENDRRRLNRNITTTFNNVLQYVFGVEAPIPKPPSPKPTEPPPAKAPEPPPQLTGTLIASATHIVDSFLASSTSSLRFQPLLVAYLDGLKPADFTTSSNELALWRAQVTSVLTFSKTLLRTSNYLERPPSQLERNVFKTAPLIARLYAATDVYRKPIVLLFEALIVTANNDREPPSLLGHLGPHTSKNFLHVISDLDKPLSRDENVSAIWHFLSVVVSNKQQWFANYLLTGKTPRDAVGLKQPAGSTSVLDKPLLTTALERLTDISKLSQKEALPMLEFITLSQNFWPWTVYQSPQHTDFIKGISDYMGSLGPIQPSTKLDGHLIACCQTKIAAHIAEILAMHLFHSRQMGTPSSIDDLVGNLSYYLRFAVGVPSLNTSLHTQLKRNFELRYPGCTPQDLKRTTLDYRPLGADYYYDIPLADTMLKASQSWTGRKNDGLRFDFQIANVNLSLVDAQIALFNSWRVLAIETSHDLQDVQLQKALIKVSIDCLVANSRSQYEEEIFSRLCHQRAEFALILTQRLVEAKCKISEMKQLLNRTWEAIRDLRGTFERELPKSEAPYYRSLLKLLFISIRAHTPDVTEINENMNASVRMAQSATVVPIILDIIKFVVSVGFREFASAIHDNAAEASPADIALVTGVLQSCLRVPGIELCQSQIVSIMATNGTARVATTLFSWSDGLAVDGDPIYGELSILFLLELSTIPLMAEQLAIEGILGHIASANITSYLRRGNVSPFADGAGLQRCYSIWQRGILPLLLNLLDAVQASIASEVATFLNQFSPLLEHSLKAFEFPEASRTVAQTMPKYISLSLCSELHSLSLLAYILANFRDAGTTEVPELKWDAVAISENVETWLTSRTILREKILPMGVKDSELAKQKSGTFAYNATTRLEERVVDELMGIKDILGADL